MDIVYYPDPVLTKQAERVNKIDEEIIQIVKEMKDVMARYEGVGLAAPQVGILKRIILIGNVKGNGSVRAYINPQIKKRRGNVMGEEGCLSFPGIYGNIIRANWVLVNAQSIDGENFEFEATEFEARVFQHEIDHLNGIVFINKFQPAEKVALKQKLENLEKDKA